MTKLIRTLFLASVFMGSSVFATVISFDVTGVANDCVGYYSQPSGGFETCVIFAEDLGQGDGDISSIIAKFEGTWETNSFFSSFDTNNVTLTGGVDDSSGSWTYTGNEIRFWVVKSSTGFRVFYDTNDASCMTDTTASNFDCMTTANVVQSGSWSTISQQGLSHIAFYDEEIRVPEPGTLALLGLGLFGMGLARRRRRVKA